MDRPPTQGQLSQALPGPKVYLTGHDASTGKAIVHSTRPANWAAGDSNQLGMAVAYSTSQFPADLEDDADVTAHDATLDPATGLFAHGLVLPSGSVLRWVEFAPGYTCAMHRTISLDYGIVLEGVVESVLDSGETTRMGRGDVMVQRATMHAWRNPSETEWARMIFVLADCKAPTVRGEVLGEDLGSGW